MKKSQTKIDKLSPEQLKAIAPLHAAAAVVAPKAEKTALSDDKNRKKLTPEQTEEELKALEQAEAEQVAEVAGEPIELAQAAEAVATDAAAGGVVAAETTSGLVGSAAVAGGVGTGAVAGGALVGAAALNNGGGDGSAAAPRELTAFNINNKTESFEQQNVIADVVEIEAASVSVGTIAADVSSSESTSLTSEGQVTTIEGEIVAAESVEINASNSGSGDDSINLGNRSFVDFELRVAESEVDTSGVHAKSVTLTAESGSVSFSQITGGGTLLTSVSTSDVSEYESVRTDISVAGAESVTIVAEFVSSSGSRGIVPDSGFINTPNLVSKNVDITTDSATSLAVAGGFSVVSEDSVDYDETDYLGYTLENSAKVSAAEVVSIEASESLDNIQIAAESIEVTGGASIGSFWSEAGSVFAGASEFIDFETEKLTDQASLRFDYLYEQTQNILGAEKVSVETSYVSNLTVLADDSNVIAENIQTIAVAGSSLRSNTSEGFYSKNLESSPYDYTSTLVQEVGAASNVYIEITGADLIEETPEMPIVMAPAAPAAPTALVASVSEIPSTSVAIYAENVEVATVGDLRGITISELSRYAISGAISSSNTSRSSYDGLENEDSYEFFSSGEYSIDAAKFVNLQADGSINSMRVAAEVFESTASHYNGLSVDGGEEGTDRSLKSRIDSEENEGYTGFASESIDIVAIGTQNSSIDVKALAGSITTVGSTDSWSGDQVTIYNAEGESQSISIDLGVGGMDEVFFSNVVFDENSYEVSEDTETEAVTVTFTFDDGEGVEDVYTLTNVEQFNFGGTVYVLNDVNQLLQPINFEA